MNWNKIINIFIMFFLCINVVMYSLHYYNEKQHYILSDERVDQLRNILEKNGFTLYDHVPTYYPMPKVVLEPPKISKSEIISSIFKDEYVNTSFGLNSEIYSSETQTLTFFKGNNKGMITYEGTNVKYTPKTFSIDDVIKAAEAFAKDITLSIPKLKLTYSRSYDDYYMLEFNETYKGEVLFCSYVNMKITKDGLIEAKALRYLPVEFVGEDKSLVPIDEVLYKFIKNESIRPEPGEIYSIKKIDLGYHIAMDTLNESVSAEAVPYYRIKLDNDLVYYVNAYTNELRNSDTNK